MNNKTGLPHQTTQANMIFDAIVIGGSYAGLSAALQLARARRQILVIDAGRPRNRFAATSHGFLGQDGRPPAAIAADGRQQLLAYPNVRWLEGNATEAHKQDDLFQVSIDSHQSVQGKRVVLASGVVDELPNITGLAERWGKSVFHCPYCHGYELNKGRIGVIAVSELSMHHALMLPDWGQVTFFTNNAFKPNEKQFAALHARQVQIENTPIAQIVEHATVQLTDDRRIMLDGMFTASRMHMASPIAQQLGCAFEDSPMGSFIRTNEGKETSITGVFACGDAARMAGSVALAVGDGAMAGVGAHRSMLFG